MISCGYNGGVWPEITVSLPSPSPRPIRRLYAFYRDADYFRQLFSLGAPIAFQQTVIALLNMVALVMVGQKGETAVAAVGLASQVFFLLNLALFGIASGSAIFTAQLWGKKDIANLRKVLGLCLMFGLLVSLIFFLISECLSAQILGIFSRDPQLIDVGSRYLRIFAWSYFFFTITYIYSLILRSTGNVRLPMFVSTAALSLNILLTFGLIFGEFGLPEMGVNGAATAIVISRALECFSLLLLSYSRRTAVAATLQELLALKFSFILNVLKPVLPVALNEFLWSMGTTAYTVVYARIGTGPIAAVNMIATIDNLAFAFITGIANATAIMVGNRIGSGEEGTAYKYAGRSLGLGALTGMTLGGIALLSADGVLSLFKVSPTVLHDARVILLIFGTLLWLRAMNSIMVVGVLRSGGDTRFCLFMDGVIIWVVGVPAAALGAFTFHLPVYWVYLLAMTEEVTKWFIGMPRYLSHKWIHDLARSVSAN
jgi:putative MATE family efflux protein